jgi:acyl-CoA reductase-like NAD-dependent aldehyde dehydrogenase
MAGYSTGQTYQLLINGNWVPAVSNRTFGSYNPSNGESLGDLAFAGKEDVERAVAAARTALTGPWRLLSPSEREALLRKLGDIIASNADELAELESLDNGKPIRHTRAIDAPVAAQLAYSFAGWPSKIAGYTPSVSVPDKFVYTRREPVGLVAIVIPWNYPLIHIMQKLSPALACGNAIILKPAEQASLAALRLGELTQEAGFPPGVVNILTGDGPVTGAALADHPGIDKVAFTGSVSAGQSVMRAAAATVKRVTLELGNKAANIIFADADLDAAIPGAFSAAFGNSGQSCVAGSRLFVHKDIYDKVVDQLIDMATTAKIGPAMDPDTELGPIIDQHQMESVLNFIQSGIDQGAEMRSGGERLTEGNLGLGYFIAPTIFTGVKDEHSIACEEIFGPVLPIFSFETEDEVISRANNTQYGLAAGIWTHDVARAHRVAAELKSGVVWVNTYDMFDAAAPFGGFKNSGFGRDNGREVIDAFTEVKAVWVNTQ